MKVMVCRVGTALQLSFLPSYLCAAAEGGADSWSRPFLPPINPKRDDISASSTSFLFNLGRRVNVYQYSNKSMSKTLNKAEEPG